ncbi:uncharacterized protein N0V89_010305 [Didymosphaeria variabile]|uniref:Aspartate/glutamate racemase family protein n=1 Tax=Didymosphaeria variabile TaxID=1932322 RepID=A0A9W8XB17_9PLEO|nr:uncharacterized protein N0V89_010305 [Didymosphaeria variabile]KAJ4346376.1 hypothetical protein N0V89_010305 [Didymosphaeria variabile]
MTTAPLPPLGFLAVEVSIHRPPGDPFNPSTWPFPLIHTLVPGSSEAQIVTSTTYPPAFIERFVSAGKELAAKGCIGIITSCGFLALAQRELASKLPIPIATSALVQIPSICAFLGSEAIVGVLTYDEERLGVAHLEALGVDAGRVRIKGMPKGGHLRRVIQEGEKYDEIRMEQEMIDAVGELLEKVTGSGDKLGAIVLECTQMPPYAGAIQRRVGVPVYDVYTMGMWFYSGLVRRKPVQWEI